MCDFYTRLLRSIFHLLTIHLSINISSICYRISVTRWNIWVIFNLNRQVLLDEKGLKSRLHRFEQTSMQMLQTTPLTQTCRDKILVHNIHALPSQVHILSSHTSIQTWSVPCISYLLAAGITSVMTRSTKALKSSQFLRCFPFWS